MFTHLFCKLSKFLCQRWSFSNLNLFSIPCEKVNYLTSCLVLSLWKYWYKLFQWCDWSHKWSVVWSLRPSSRAEQVPWTCYRWYGGATDQPLATTSYLSPVSPLSTRQCFRNANSWGMCPMKQLHCNNCYWSYLFWKQHQVILVLNPFFWSYQFPIKTTHVFF